jgi:hypothetical protein
MGCKIPSMELYGVHQCGQCGSETGPHYWDGKRIKCIKCDIADLERGNRIASVALGFIVLCFCVVLFVGLMV